MAEVRISEIHTLGCAGGLTGTGLGTLMMKKKRKNEKKKKKKKMKNEK